jgi:hypothetical protein
MCGYVPCTIPMKGMYMINFFSESILIMVFILFIDKYIKDNAQVLYILKDA